MGDRMHGLQPGDEVYSGNRGGRHDATHSAAQTRAPSQVTRTDTAGTRRCAGTEPYADQEPAVAKRLGVSVEDLLGDGSRPASRCGSTPKMQQQMDRITQLPRARQQFVMEVIESVLAQSSR